MAGVVHEDDTDRGTFLDVWGKVVADCNGIGHGYCLMTNHYHRVIETPDGNLSKGMRQLNGVFTQYSNGRHGRAGHLLQGRYTAILVDGDRYLLERARYVVLNPVRANRVAAPGAWSWSGYRAMIGALAPPGWLAADGLRAAFADRRPLAVERYVRWVADGIGRKSIWAGLNGQVFLGDESFVARSLRHAKDRDDVNIPKAQRRPPAPSLDTIASKRGNRAEAIVAAHASGAYCGVHFIPVGRIVRAAKAGQRPRRRSRCAFRPIVAVDSD